MSIKDDNMLYILIFFPLIILLDVKALKRDPNKKLVSIYCFFICMSLFISVVLRYNLSLPTPADFIEGFLRMLGVSS